MVARKSVSLANSGRRVLYCAPQHSQTDAYWEMLAKWLWPGIQCGYVYRNETKRLLRWKDGGQIQCKTASLPDHLRGAYADFLILDEYAYQPNDDIWSKVGSPMLIDNDGSAMFISTANFRNHFFLLALQAQENDDGRWSFYKFPSTENPHLSRSAITELAKDMTAEAYRQEILAEFVEGEGRVFRMNPEDFLPPAGLDRILEGHRGHRIVGGMDWGRHHDYTALSIGCSTCSMELLLRRWKSESYPAQRDIIRGLYLQLDGAGMRPELLSEENAMGTPNMEQLREDGVAVQGLMMTNASKSQLVGGLRLAFEQRSWKWVKDEAGWRELEGYESKVTIQGQISYNAPEALHDDTIIARMLMLHQAKAGVFSMAS